MVRLTICAVIFILLISSSSCIMIKGYSQKYTKIPNFSSDHSFYFMRDTKTNSYLSNDISTYTLNNETKNQQHFNFEKDALRRHITTRFTNPIQEKHTESFKSPGQYLSSSTLSVPIKSDLKPVYESTQELQFEETADQNANGYFYDRPTSENIQVFKDYHKEPEYSALELTAAILELNRLIQSIEKTKSYNSILHLPSNPVLALILSHYGKYTTGTSKYHPYSYAASNNVHNNKPNGQYKYAIDDI